MLGKTLMITAQAWCGNIKLEGSLKSPLFGGNKEKD